MANSGPVVHILRAPLGGLLRHVADVAKAQSARGIAVGLVCDNTDYGEGTRQRLAELEGICALGVMKMPIPRTPAPADFAALYRLYGHCRRHSPIVLHGHGAKGAAYARILAPMVRAIAVCTPHGGALHYSFDSITGAVFLLMERALKRSTDGMIFESDYARAQYVQKVGRISFPYRVIHNGLYEEEFAPVTAASAEYDFLFIGELRTLKGPFVLLEAIKRLRASGRKLRVLMAGSGPDEGALREQIERERIGDTVVLSPPIHPARAAFAKARCIVSPSLNESMPYLVLEALAARVPLITTAVGGIPEIFGRAAHRLVPPGDAVALAQRMEQFLDAPQEHASIAAQMHEHLRDHLTVAQMDREMLEFYSALASADGPGVARTRASS